MSEKEFNSRLRKIRAENVTKERKAMLKAEKEKYKPKLQLPSTSKIVLIAVFLICIELLIYCEYAMLALEDASAMYALIGIPATLIPVILGYYHKSKIENSTGGIVYEKTMFEMNQANASSNTEDDNEAVG